MIQVLDGSRGGVRSASLVEPGAMPVASASAMSRKIQGRPRAARPIMIASAPVESRMCRACCGVAMSPLAISVIGTSARMARIESCSAGVA